MHTHSHTCVRACALVLSCVQVYAQLEAANGARGQLGEEVARLEASLAGRASSQERQVSALQQQLHEAQHDNQQLLARLQVGRAVGRSRARPALPG